MSGETKFTSGHWQTRNVDFDDENWRALNSNVTHITITQQGMGEVIAVVWGDDSDNRKANAHLIAASPELYEALEAVVRIAGRDTAEFNAARDALAKARGESQ